MCAWIARFVWYNSKWGRIQRKKNVCTVCLCLCAHACVCSYFLYGHMWQMHRLYLQDQCTSSVIAITLVYSSGFRNSNPERNVKVKVLTGCFYAFLNILESLEIFNRNFITVEMKVSLQRWKCVHMHRRRNRGGQGGHAPPKFHKGGPKWCLVPLDFYTCLTFAIFCLARKYSNHLTWPHLTTWN